ncbi:MAG: N-acetylmuramoyl-L-alanine amidase, partial [Anaerolineae bacterium]|nr:N-acetylmuramoyl-L-alanine amidase [Anaerolineae bacterium]
MRDKKLLSRREFLGVAGLGALATSVACGTSLVSYLLLRHGTDSAGTNRPTTTPTRPSTIKQIDRPPIVTRAAWGARAPNHQATYETGFYSLDNPEGWREYTGDIRTTYRTVVVHHSAEYDTDDLTTVRFIQNLHMDTRGWADLAYHFLVGKTGTIYEGRALNVRGTHTAEFNTGSVGVVFLGYLHLEQPTPEQLHEGRRLINWLTLRLELTH